MNFKIHAPVYNCSGYARFRHIILELVKLGHVVQLIPYQDCIDRITIDDREVFSKLESIKLTGKYISIHVGIAYQFKVDCNASANVGYTMFEANTVPKNWVNFCNRMDRIVVPSNFCKDIFSIAGVNNVEVVPLGVDDEKFRTISKCNKQFTFLSIGTWIDRKGWDILLNAFVKEFENQDDVVLQIKTSNSTKQEKDLVLDYLSKLPNRPKIAICNAKLNEEVIPTLYQQADCYVLPSYGEAFSLTYLEAMACGIPVIATNYGGHLDYLDNKNCELIDVEQMVPLTERMIKINQMYYGLLFAKPDMNHLRKLMRKVYENRHSDKIQCGLETVKKYTWSMAAKKLVKICEKMVD